MLNLQIEMRCQTWSERHDNSWLGNINQQWRLSDLGSLSLNVNFIYIFETCFSPRKRASCIQLHKVGFHIVNICLFAIKNRLCNAIKIQSRATDSRGIHRLALTFPVTIPVVDFFLVKNITLVTTHVHYVLLWWCLIIILYFGDYDDLGWKEFHHSEPGKVRKGAVTVELQT